MATYPRLLVGGLAMPVVHGRGHRLVVQSHVFCVGESMGADGAVELVVVAQVAIEDRWVDRAGVRASQQGAGQPTIVVEMSAGEG